MSLRTAFFASALTSITLIVACGFESEEPTDLPVGTLYQALGVPKDGFPNWEERLILVLTNRARSDPAAEVAAVCPACSVYSPSKPLEYSQNRGRAARFQATSLLKAGSGLMHESVCTLVSNLGSIYPKSCDGSPSCACEGKVASCSCTDGSPFCTAPGGLTSWTARVSRFGVSASGENAAAGNSDPIKTFQQWVKSKGHWSNLNKSSHTKLGTGHFGGNSGCYKDIWAQVFGGGAPSAQVLWGGAHYPQKGTTASTFTFWANYFDLAGAPKMATVNIDGTCHPMTLERGKGTNGTLVKKQTFGAAGCHRYYFRFRDASGDVATYPTSGSFGLGVATASCANYSATRPGLGAGCGCDTSAECSDADPCTADTCVGNKCQHAPISGCCKAAAECADKDPCTADTCVGNKCQHAPISGCCKAAAECDDDNVCTTDSCAGNKCKHAPVEGCCNIDSQCDDEDPCTADSCAGNACQHAPVSGCCKADADCDDGTDCTTDSCADNACQHAAVSGCCKADADCKDNDPCSAETCQLPEGTCEMSPIQGCCIVDAECDDADPCTLDTCDLSSHTCEHQYQTAPGCEEETNPDGDYRRAGAGEEEDLGGGCSLGNGASAGGIVAPLLLLLLFIGFRRRG